MCHKNVSTFKYRRAYSQVTYAQQCSFPDSGRNCSFHYGISALDVFLVSIGCGYEHYRLNRDKYD